MTQQQSKFDPAGNELIKTELQFEIQIICITWIVARWIYSAVFMH